MRDNTILLRAGLTAEGGDPLRVQGVRLALAPRPELPRLGRPVRAAVLGHGQRSYRTGRSREPPPRRRERGVVVERGRPRAACWMELLVRGAK